MKKFILLLVVSTFISGGCSNSASQKSAIESVFTQRATVKTVDEPIGLLGEQQLAGLMAIDVRNCPPDFRAAWFDYLVEVQNLHTRMKRVAMFAAGEGKTVNDTPALVKFVASNSGFAQYLLGGLDKTDEAWGKLERTAMNYGVIPGPEKTLKENKTISQSNSAAK